MIGPFSLGQILEIGQALFNIAKIVLPVLVG